ncbi:MAG: NAD(+) synthase [Clostridiales Family XIII bacterium]|jgi:NAD+ synthase (glutamine-hydrolysing)|nr:NAD(+) synthase [Clostridiales Family XIII bacterium]
MFDGFIRVAAISPEVRVADCAFNAARIEESAREASDRGAVLICAPELSLTGYTCGDLFLQDALIENARKALATLVKNSKGRKEIVVVGLPFVFGGKLYNVAAVYGNGDLFGLVPKSNIPNYGEFYEIRHFTAAEDTLLSYTQMEEWSLEDDIPFGSGLLFRCEEESDFTFSVEICEDLWVAEPPSGKHAKAGATIIVNLSAGNEIIGKASYRRLLAKSQSGRLVCGYIYSNAGGGESSTDMVFSGHSIIAENGNILAESKLFEDTTVLTEIDVRGLARDRRYLNSFKTILPDDPEYLTVYFPCEVRTKEVTGNVIPFSKYGVDTPVFHRYIDSHPFVPDNIVERAERCEEILTMQAAGLAKRLAFTGAQNAVLGISGGLDSTLALLVAVRAMQKIGKTPDTITALTMPGFGTSSRTNDNAHRLCAALGVSLREVDITESVKEHLKVLGHDIDDHSVVFENAQARIRTLILMDTANKCGGIVVGTGDLSELALGWSTYNGDHMSMYGVNAGVPKTLVRHMVRYVSDISGAPAKDGKAENLSLSEVLIDILDTPVSPELLPTENGEISQKTEDLIGPYELHDFFLYHMVRWGRKPQTILQLASYAFGRGATRRGDIDANTYDEETIRKWLCVFYRRFFTQQFKRSALPDGPKIGSVALSPRGDWRMPSDAEVRQWLEELNES